MDDLNTPAAAWLTFSLAFPNATKLCKLLHEVAPSPTSLGQLIQRHLEGQSTGLQRTLSQEVSDEDFSKLHSPHTQEQVDRALAWEASSPDNHIITLDDEAYPLLLQRTDYAPPLLYAQGSLSALSHPLLAVVGSRKASSHALSHTRQCCRELADLGIGIVSGLALGIDASAHEGALDCSGVTIAVAATEPDRVYPKRHKELAARIIGGGGLILTEHHIGSITRPWFFPQRNRIISGLSLGVLVAEAALPSGTLTTANHAMNQGREVMAVPGSIHNLQAKGCHALIKQGAALVESTQDILDTLAQPLERALAELKTRPQPTADSQMELMPHSYSALPVTLDATDKWLLMSLSSHPATVDDLMTLAKDKAQEITISALSTALGRLELKGLISVEPGGRYARC